MSGELRPGRRLNESRIAEMLGVSRTPVRQALVRLETAGAIYRDEDGYYPRIPDPREVEDLYELREVIELHGIDRIIGKSREETYDVADLSQLRDEWRVLQEDQPAPSPDIVLLDEDFHERILLASGNRSMVEVLRLVNAKIRIIRMYDYITEDRVTATVAEHLAILDALLAEDFETARHLVRQNITDGYQVVRERARAAIGFGY